MSNSILNAFIQQTYGSIEKAQASDKLADNQKNIDREICKQKEKDAMVMMLRSKNISDHMNIPSKLKPNELNTTTEIHPQFKKYDHSLEVDRTEVAREKFLNEKYKNDPENKPTSIDFKYLEAGSVEDAFNNIFKD